MSEKQSIQATWYKQPSVREVKVSPSRMNSFYTKVRRRIRPICVSMLMFLSISACASNDDAVVRDTSNTQKDLTNLTSENQMNTNTESQHLKDRMDVIDVLYRFAQGIDAADAAVMRSTLTDDCVLIFTEAAQAAGAPAPRIDGGDEFANGVAALLSQLDATHSISNPFVTLDGDKATLTALVEGMHFPKGDRSRYILQKNRYNLTLVRESDGMWRIKRFVLDNAWTQGDPRVISEVVERLEAEE